MNGLTFDWLAPVQGSACVNITTPGAIMHPESVAQYSWREQMPYARGYYNSSTESYEFAWNQWLTGLGSHIGAQNVETPPDHIRIKLYDDMSLEVTPKSFEWSPPIYQLASSANLFKDQVSKTQLFNEDGSLKTCDRFWVLDGWGTTYMATVKDVNGVSEMHWIYKRDGHREPNVREATSRTFTRFDAVKKTYQYIGMSDGSEWTGNSAPSDKCKIEHLYELFRPEGLSIGTYCEGPILNGIWIDFGCADDHPIVLAPPSPPPPPLTSVAVYRIKDFGWDASVLNAILPDKTEEEKQAFKTNNPPGTVFTVGKIQPILDLGLSLDTLQRFVFDVFGTDSKMYRITGAGHYYIEYVLPSKTAEERDAFKTKYPVGSFIPHWEMDSILALNDPYFPYYFQTFGSTGKMYRITGAGHYYIEYVLPSKTAEEREAFKTQYPVGSYLPDSQMEPILALNDPYFPYYFETFGSNSYTYRITGAGHYYIEYVLPSKTAEERESFKTNYPVGSFLPDSEMDPILALNDPYFPYYFETFGTFAPPLMYTPPSV